MSWVEKVICYVCSGLLSLTFISRGLDYVGAHSFNTHWCPALRTEGLGGHSFQTETQNKECGGEQGLRVDL